MSAGKSSEACRKLVHDARQPLNSIRLVTANMRARLTGKMNAAEADWLSAKLEKIDRQVDRLAALLEGQE